MRFLLIFIIPIQFLFGQEINEPNIKSGITKSKNKSFYFENDRKGNMIFLLNEGMNGPITMISASEYDNLNRMTKSYWVHSNLGYYLSEKIYENGCVKNYEYTAKLDSIYLFNREYLKKIKTRREFTEMKVFQVLEKSTKHLSSVEFLDSVNNVIKEIYFSESGDTTSINYYKYNSNNQETLFHYGTIGDEFWTWDIYYLYNNHNKISKSFRVSSSNEIEDTTEVYNYLYDDIDRLISDNYYYKTSFRNRTDYYYNANNLVIEELFYEDSETELDVKTIFKYDKKGNVKKKIQFDYRNLNNEQKEVLRYKREYW